MNSKQDENSLLSKRQQKNKDGLLLALRLRKSKKEIGERHDVRVQGEELLDDGIIIILMLIM